jgi:hypothetical protein
MLRSRRAELRSSVLLTHPRREHDFGIDEHNDWIAQVSDSDAG